MRGPFTHAERRAGSASPGAKAVRGKTSRVPGLSRHLTVPEAQVSFAWTSEVPVETKNLGEGRLLDPSGIESRQPQVLGPDAGPTQSTQSDIDPAQLDAPHSWSQSLRSKKPPGGFLHTWVSGCW